MATRSTGAIASMLLLIDWHVKAINFPSDFTDADCESGGPLTRSVEVGGPQRYGMASALEKLNILSPADRSNNMP